MESSLLKQGMQSSTTDGGNYSSFQSSETVKTSSSSSKMSSHSSSVDDHPSFSSSSTSTSTVVGGGGGGGGGSTTTSSSTRTSTAFSDLGGGGSAIDILPPPPPSAFAVVPPHGGAAAAAPAAPVISEQMESKSSESYSKVESSDAKSEVMEKSEQSTMERSETYAVSSSSSSTLQQQQLQQQQLQQQQLQQQQQQHQPLMMMMMMNKSQTHTQGQGLPIADMTAPPFPVQQSYETKSERSHIYKRIEHGDVSQGFVCPPPPLIPPPPPMEPLPPLVPPPMAPLSPPPPLLAPLVQPMPPQIGTDQAGGFYHQQHHQHHQEQQQHHHDSSGSGGYQVLSPFQSSTQHYESSVSEQQQQHEQQQQQQHHHEQQQQQQQEVTTSSMHQHSSMSASDNLQSRQMAGVNSGATTTTTTGQQQQQQQHHHQQQHQQQQQVGGSQVYGQSTYMQQPLYQETPMMSPQTASTATRELDELMASLSEFRVANRDNSVAPHIAGGDPAYARPHMLRNESAGTTSVATSSMGTSSGVVTAKGDQLDSMLGSLQSDMNRQGVSTKTKGLCAACNKPVVSQMITALGKVWHVEHFTCAHCNMTLGTMSFYERDNNAYCEKDYHSLFAPRCAYCNGPIVDKCVTALDKTWHPEHFFCGLCGRNFGDEGFHERGGQAYCREDFLKMFAPKCGGCAQPIKDSYISALNRHWHPDCFVCWQCQVPFGNTSFFDHDGLPYCEQHYHAKRGSLCSDCQQPITGPSIIAMGRKFHPKHFTCAFCRKQLNNVTFKEQNDKPYCHPCFSKLFAGTKMMD